MATDTQANPFAEALVEVGDGSSVTDPAALQATIEELTTVEKRGISSYRGMTTVLKQCARLRVQARSLISTPAGNSDWAASSDAYRVTVLQAEAALWAESTPDEKRRIDGAIRQHITRTYLEPGITGKVLAGMTAEDLAEVKYADNPEGLTVLTGEIPAKIKTAIAAQYKAAGLNVPPKFGGTRGGGGGGTEGPDNPVAAFEVALGGLEKMAPHVAASDLLRAVSALADKLDKEAKSEVAERADVEATLLRIAEVARGSAATLSGKNPGWVEAGKSARWNKDKDQH